MIWLFQSPPSVRKATWFPALPFPPVPISIPAFREEGDFCPSSPRPTPHISIPAFREEGDNFSYLRKFPAVMISIPAFREEGDNKFQQEIAKTQGIKQPFLQTVTRNHSLSGKNPKVD